MRREGREDLAAIVQASVCVVVVMIAVGGETGDLTLGVDLNM